MPQPRPAYILKRGNYDAPKDQPIGRGNARGAAAVSRRCAAQPARPGPLADRSPAPADGARGGQPLLADVLRPRHRGHDREFRHARGPADASRTARLAGARLHRIGLGREATLQEDRAVVDLPAAPRPRRWSSANATPTICCWRAARAAGCPPRCCATRRCSPAACLWTRSAGRPRQAVSAAGPVACGKTPFCRNTCRTRARDSIAAACTRSGGAPRRRRTCSPSTPRPRGLRRAPADHQHAAAAAGAAERPAVRRGRPRPGRTDAARGRRLNRRAGDAGIPPGRHARSPPSANATCWWGFIAISSKRSAKSRRTPPNTLKRGTGRRPQTGQRRTGRRDRGGECHVEPRRSSDNAVTSMQR